LSDPALAWDCSGCTGKIFRFGAFELDGNTGELRKQGVRIKLQHKPFLILAVLLEQPGELISRDRLQSTLWPAATYVDFDQGLNTAIRRLRRALSDIAAAPRFIETHPRRGYRFLAPVQVAARPTSFCREAQAAAVRRGKMLFLKRLIWTTFLLPVLSWAIPHSSGARWANR